MDSGASPSVIPSAGTNLSSPAIEDQERFLVANDGILRFWERRGRRIVSLFVSERQARNDGDQPSRLSLRLRGLYTP